MDLKPFSFDTYLDLKLGIHGVTEFAMNSTNRNVYMEDTYDYEITYAYGNSVQSHFITLMNSFAAICFTRGLLILISLNDFLNIKLP